MAIIDKLRTEGITFIYISHRINEVLEISDKITILRDGKYIRTFINDENLTEDDLVNSMVGLFLIYVALKLISQVKSGCRFF